MVAYTKPQHRKKEESEIACIKRSTNNNNRPGLPRGIFKPELKISYLFPYENVAYISLFPDNCYGFLLS